MKSEKHSPLKSKALRYAGKSLDERIDKLINDDALPYLLMSIFLILMAAYEWWRFYANNPPPAPKFVTSIAILVVVFSFYKIRKISKEIKNIKLGREGERAVGEYLDLLREKGYKIFHDIIGENFNIDHVIISTKGIFSIETKTFSKPNNNDAKIRFDGKNITVEGLNIKKNPITQASASSTWLTELLKASTGKNFTVKPVVVFPGWYIETTEEGKQSNCWVLNPKALPKYIDNENQSISEEAVSLTSYHLSRYVRAKEGEISKPL